MVEEQLQSLDAAPKRARRGAPQCVVDALLTLDRVARELVKLPRGLGVRAKVREDFLAEPDGLRLGRQGERRRTRHLPQMRVPVGHRRPDRGEVEIPGEVARTLR
ncbi:MAG: hypothetical protein ACYCU6_07825, partial [Acidimicrobiales bacterium]